MVVNPFIMEDGGDGGIIGFGLETLATRKILLA